MTTAVAMVEAARRGPASAVPVLELRGIHKEFVLAGGLVARLFGRGRRLVALAGVDLVLPSGGVLGLVGESGSGKSTLAQIAVRLEPPTAGRVVHRGIDITAASGRGLRDFRRRVQIVFQDTTSSLNPRKTIGRVLGESLDLRGVARGERRREATALLAAVGLGVEMLPRYPHQLSGGQRQRVGIARALAMQPELLVADEPVSALDVSLQAQIVLLLEELRRRLGLTMLFITHDLALAGVMSSEIAVMYAGQIVEQGLPDEVLGHPAHPYTQALIAAMPAGLAGRQRRAAPTRAAEPVGTPGRGCSFAARCPAALPVCRAAPPAMTALSPTHRASCHRL